MKLDQVKVYSLVSWISSRSDHAFDEHECAIIADKLNNLEEANTEAYQPPKADIELVNQLMKWMCEGVHKIEAIKVHRQLTGLGLKESKDAVEKYWVEFKG